MTRPFDIITFDCYGTLIDWNAGITGAFRDAAAREGVALDREALLRAYHEVEPAVQRAAYRPYREVLADVASGCAVRFRWPLDPGRSAFLAESLGGWMPFPDTNPMLERLVAMGFELGILSNVDEALFAETRRHFTVSFGLVVTAEQVRSYKPHHGHFLAARKRIGGRRWLHAAQSYFHDIVPARALDIPVVWVNRGGSQPSGPERPAAEVASLGGLVDWLEAGAVPQVRP